MRIISNFKDYYDIGLKYGIDPNIIYMRQTEEIDLGAYKTPLANPFGDTNLHITFILIGFCGKTYPVIKATIGRTFKAKIHYIYSLKDFIDLLQSPIVHYPIHPKRTRSKVRHKRNIERYTKLLNSPDIPEWGDCARVKRFFQNPPNLDKYFDKYKVPVLLIIEDKLILNPRLEDLDFPSIVDPYTAFNELSMFIGNWGVPSPHTVDIKDDEIKRDKKGFDKWSFKRKVHPRKSKKSN